MPCAIRCCSLGGMLRACSICCGSGRECRGSPPIAPAGGAAAAGWRCRYCSGARSSRSPARTCGSQGASAGASRSRAIRSSTAPRWSPRMSLQRREIIARLRVARLQLEHPAQQLLRLGRRVAAALKQQHLGEIGGVIGILRRQLHRPAEGLLRPGGTGRCRAGRGRACTTARDCPDPRAAGPAGSRSCSSMLPAAWRVVSRRRRAARRSSFRPAGRSRCRSRRRRAGRRRASAIVAGVKRRSAVVVVVAIGADHRGKKGRVKSGAHEQKLVD